MRVADSQSFPLFWGLCSQEGGEARVGGHIVQHKWYYGQTSSGKFWSLCDKYGSRTHKFSLWGDYGPLWGDMVPFWGHFERLYWPYGSPNLFKFGSIWDKYNGRYTQIPFWGKSPPLNLLKFPLEFMENLWRYSSHGPLPLCQISSLCDKRCRRNTFFIFCHLRTSYVPTYVSIPRPTYIPTYEPTYYVLMRSAKPSFATRIKNWSLAYDKEICSAHGPCTRSVVWTDLQSLLSHPVCASSFALCMVIHVCYL